MPYITQDARDRLREDEKPYNPGELNYMITKLAHDYVAERGLSYKVINDVIGALEGAKLEFYSKTASLYEAKKERQNGDVYDDASIENRAWAGGFFEGEGCFYAHYNKARQDGTQVYRTAASLSQKGKEGKSLLKEFKNVVKCGVIYGGNTEKDMYTWKTSKKEDVHQVFELLRPFLGERRQKTYFSLVQEEEKQEFNPSRARPDREKCRNGHKLKVVGKIKDGSCRKCDSISKRKYYEKKRREKEDGER